MKIGEKAPDFTLIDGAGNEWTLSEQKGKTVLLLFYPGDNTPVCTKQMCSVRDNWDDYLATGAEVVGISTDPVDSHHKFSEKYDLPLKLLSDEKAEVIRKYGVGSWFPGKSSRAEVVIDKDGSIAYYNVQSLGIFKASDAEVIAAIEEAN
ncbi:MAG: peroxiredoxin [Acidobacteriota bacterium]|nr:peroxiredoxin [Acidobacteriota bacterium]MDH3528404.1 peroxiredoxin [Acidobacteriota bacterium]